MPNHHKVVPLAERFWPKVAKSDGCWLWTAATDGRGYGVIGLGSCAQGIDKAYRVSYRLAYGDIPDGMEVCHRCDTPACVRPDHLFLGSHKENMADMAEKKRVVSKPPKGSASPLAKITEADVVFIRTEYAAKRKNQHQLSAQFGITQAAISLIVQRKNWGHVP